MQIKFPLKVAVVDDDRVQREFISGLLSGIKSITVQTFENPKEALEAIKQNDFHIVITDINMPTMQGDLLLREIMDLRKGTDVIVQTGYDTIMNAFSCFKAGARYVLKKPVDKEELLRAIFNCLDHFHHWGKLIDSTLHKDKAK